MLSPYRSRRWVFALGDVTHKVEARLSVGRHVRVTVDGEVIEWPLTWLDVLDFGGRFDFEMRAAPAGGGGGGGGAPPAVHACRLTVNTINMYLSVNGVDIETGKPLRPVSIGRWVIRVVAFLLAAFLFYWVNR